MSDCFVKAKSVLCLVEVPHPHLMCCWIGFADFTLAVWKKLVIQGTSENKNKLYRVSYLAKVLTSWRRGNAGNPILLVSFSSTWPAHGPLWGAQFGKYCNLWHTPGFPTPRTFDSWWFVTSDADNFLISLSKNF